MSLRTLAKPILRKLFETGQRAGLDILPRHYYSEIPAIAELRRSIDWRKPYSMADVRGAELESQLAFVERCCTRELIDRQRANDIYAHACARNQAPGYGPIEADFLYCFIRTQRPRRVVQIGCGVSTAVMLLAAEEARVECEITCIDPYPTDLLRREAANGTIRLVAEKAELVLVDHVKSLSGGDLLFIDSTHTLRPGGEVPRVILEGLPRLAGGAWIHFHDIYFPYDYTRELLTADLFFPHESVLLHAYLCGNATMSVAASLAMLHYARPEALRRFLPNYRPAANSDGLNASEGHFPSSIYLRRETPPSDPGRD